MTDLNNKLNLNNVTNAYTPNFKKGEEEAKPQQHVDCENCEVKGDGTKAADSYGRALVKQSGKIDNPDTVQCVKDSVEAFLKNPQACAVHNRAMDDLYELNAADGIDNPYEEACCCMGDACDNAAKK